MQLVTRNGIGGYHWQLVRQLPGGADIVACGAHGYVDTQACQAAADRLVDAVNTMTAFEETPQGWRWRVLDCTGEPLAESPVGFRSLAECQEALHGVRVGLGVSG